MKVLQVIDVLKLCEISFSYTFDDYERYGNDSIDNRNNTVKITIYGDDIHEYTEADNDKEVENWIIDGSISRGDRYENEEDGIEVKIYLR